MWHKNGSLLVAANGQEAAGLQKQVELLNSVGVGAELLDAQRTRSVVCFLGATKRASGHVVVWTIVVKRSGCTWDAGKERD
jgi:hypothetical protein